MTGILYPALIMGGLGLIFGALLAFASEKFSVKVDPRQAEVRAILPGANCGACGFPGCDAFAEAVIEGTTEVSGCTAATSEVIEEIAAIIGVEANTELSSGSNNSRKRANRMFVWMPRTWHLR